ncbi:MAG TPA: 6-phosphofructokinase, partial [Thermoanaerobaculia bacterium]|nr:6-phosphofructokinase [Thermoanaerobaculia bacterium]
MLATASEVNAQHGERHRIVSAAMKRIGILTGGGDCPGLNAVIRAAARTLIRDHDLEVVGIQLGFEGLLTKSIVPLTLESIR